MECCKASQFPNDDCRCIHLVNYYDKPLMWHFSVGRGSLGRVLLLQESSHLVPLLLQQSSLHFLSFFVKTFLVYLFPLLF